MPTKREYALEGALGFFREWFTTRDPQPKCVNYINKVLIAYLIPAPRRQHPYDEAPSNRVDTSVAAARQFERVRAGYHREVYDAIALSGGLTCDEVEQRLGIKHQTCSARIRELELLAKIKKTPTTRPTRSGRQARVYSIVGPYTYE